MRELIFSGASLSEPVTFVTDRFKSSLDNLTVSEIRLGQNVLSVLPELGSRTQVEVDLLASFLRINYAAFNFKEFAAKNGLTLSEQDQTSRNTLVEIKATGLDVDAVNYQAGSKFTRYTFASTPDLSELSFGDYISVTGSTNPSNDGLYQIQAVNDGSDYVDVLNQNRSDTSEDEASSPGTGIISNF